MLVRRGPLLALLSLSLMIATSAWADEAPPPDPCDGLEVGDACKDWSRSGTCVKQTCSRLSYANGEPESVEYDCVGCHFGDPPAKEEPAKPAAGADKPVADPGEAAEEQRSAGDIPPKGGCSIGPGLGGSSLLFVGLGLLGLRRRGRA